MALSSALAERSAEVGWELDGPSAVRVLTLFGVTMNAGDEEGAEVIEMMGEAERIGFFALLEDVWVSGHAAARGE